MYRYKLWVDFDGVVLHVHRYNGAVVLRTGTGDLVVLMENEVQELIEHLKGESE